MKMKYLFGLALILFGSLPTESFASEKSFRIATFNILTYNPTITGVNAWPNRLPLVVKQIRQAQMDIIGFQECTAAQVEDLLGQMPEYTVVDDLYFGERKTSCGVRIFYKTDRFEVLNKGLFFLAANTVNPGKGWDAESIRMCVWVQLKDRVSGKKFFHFNTHLDHKGTKAREEGAKLINRKIDEIVGSKPCFVTGDFNHQPNSKTYATMTEHMYDSRLVSKEAPKGPEFTFADFKTPKFRIDYIFVQGVKVLEYEVLTQVDGRYPSDHCAVVIKAEVK